MAALTFTANLDGFTDLNQPQGGIMGWSGGISGQGVFQDGIAGDTFTANFTLTNGGWTINSLFVLSGGESTTNITDGDAGFGRVIDYLNVGNNSDIDLINSQISHIVGYGSGTHDINLGSAFTRSISIGGTQTTIVVNTGGLGHVDIFDGIANLTVNANSAADFIQTSDAADTLTVFGEVGLASLAGGNNVVGVQGFVAALGVGDGNDDITVDASGRIELLVSEGGNDTVDLNLDGRIGKLNQDGGTLVVETEDNARLEVAETNNTNVTLNVSDTSRIESFLSFAGNVTANVIDSGRIDLLRVDNGNGTINLSGQGRVRDMQLWEGVHNVTTADRYINSINLFESSSTITIGSGGAGSIRSFADTAQTHTWVFNGYVESAQLGDFQTMNLTIGSQGSGHIKLREGADVVTTGTGGVTLIETRDGNDTINVGDGGVDAIFAGNDDDTITLTGSNSRVGNLVTGRGNNTVTLDAGSINSAALDDGNDTVTLTNAARINQLRDFGGTDTFTLSGDSRIEQLEVEGNTTITLNDSSRFFQLKADSGQLNLTTGSAFIESVTGFDVQANVTINGGLGQLRIFNETEYTNTIVLNGFTNSVAISDRFSDNTDNQSTNLTVNGELNVAELGNGNDTVTTGSDFVGVIKTRLGDDSIVVGSGGMELAATREGNDTITTSDGFVDVMRTGDGDDVVNIGSGGAQFVETGRDEDAVTSTTGYVQVISTGDGNDTIEVGTGGAGAVFAGDGDDLIILNDMSANSGITVYGGSGQDTVSFENITIDVFFSMLNPGLYQNIGADDPNLNMPGVIGYVQESRVENIIGSDNNDGLQGDNGENVIVSGDGNDSVRGAKGNDTLSGGNDDDTLLGENGKDRLEGNQGNDTLEGGRGNDFLRGGGGNDVFVFEAGAGTDKIRDFVQGQDIMEISDHAGGFGSLVISTVGSDLRVEHDGGVITLILQGGTTLTSADFDFGI